jgi:lactoylglutathione lyase
MDVIRNGLILFVEKYEACVEFYKRALSLSIWYAKPDLTCFRFGQSYLMVERGGVAADSEKTRALSPVILRLNVVDIEAACVELQSLGVASATVTRFPWGRVVHFLDPDGNSIQLCQWPENAGLPSF